MYYINDGSRDKTYEKILELKKKVSKERNSAVKISYLSFTHNFGHEAAMCAGMNTSKADYMIVMDVDLQNPPQKIPEILKKFEQGADCVLLKRAQYKNVSLMKKITSNGYYLFSKYILRNANERNVSDFFAVDKTLAKKVNDNYKTRLRFIRGFVQREATCLKKVNFKNGIRFSGVS
ncbi:MAG: glycosyltransferase, partial [Lachnospiraceae bacterium]|nr:glycosyltransferase [Lachnospiraceae bacterium]